jgi:hypothetical protein
VQPEACLFQRAHHAFGIRIPLGVVVAGERLVNSQGATGVHERPSRWVDSHDHASGTPLALGHPQGTGD